MRRKHAIHHKHHLPVHEQKPNPFIHKSMLVVAISILITASIAYFILSSTEFRTAGKAASIEQGLAGFPSPFVEKGKIEAQIIIPNNPSGNERAAANKILQALTTIKCVPDNCQAIANQDQKDTDNDTIGDACDNCRIKENTNQQDSDADGIGDACDNCAQVSNRDQKDSNNNTAGDACEPLGCPDALILLAANITQNSTNTDQEIQASFWFERAGTWIVQQNNTAIPGTISISNLSGTDSDPAIDSIKVNTSCQALGVWVHTTGVLHDLAISTFTNGSWITSPVLTSLEDELDPAIAYHSTANEARIVYVTTNAQLQMRIWNGSVLLEPINLLTGPNAQNPEIVHNTQNGFHIGFIGANTGASRAKIIKQNNQGVFLPAEEIPLQHRNALSDLRINTEQRIGLAASQQGVTIISWAADVAGKPVIYASALRNNFILPAIMLTQGTTPSTAFNLFGQPTITYTNKNQTRALLLDPIPLIAEDFSDNTSQGFRQETGVWNIEAGTIHQTTGIIGNIFAGNQNLRNYILTADISMNNSQASPAILFRTQSNTTHYKLILEGQENTVQLIKVTNNVITPLAIVAKPLPINTEQRVHISVNENTIRIHLNEELIIELTDATPITQGGIGLQSGQNTQYDNIIVINHPIDTLVENTTEQNTLTSTTFVSTNAAITAWRTGTTIKTARQDLNTLAWTPQQLLKNSTSPALTGININQTCQCAPIQQQVCADGVTFANNCIAQCQGKQNITQGPCCITNSDCLFGQTCTQNNCKNCFQTSECPQGTICTSSVPQIPGLCVECVTNSQCPRNNPNARICAQPGKCVECTDSNPLLPSANCPATKQFCSRNSCVQCTADSQCTQGQACQNNQCGTICDSAGLKTVFAHAFTTLTNFTPQTGIWAIVNNTAVTTDSSLVKLLKSPFTGNMNSVSTTFTDQNNQAFIIFTTSQNTVIAAGIRTTDQKQVVLEQWTPGQSTLLLTGTNPGIVPFITPGVHTLKVRLNPNSVQVLIDCQAFLNISTAALSSITGTGIGIASGNGTFQDFIVQENCLPGSFIPTGASITSITGAQVVNPDPDNDGIPNTCVQDQIIRTESEIKNIFQTNNIIIGTHKNNQLITTFSGKKVLKGYTQLELQQQQGNAWLIVNGGTSQDILSSVDLFKNSATLGFQGQKACIKTTITGPVIDSEDCPTCTEQCQQNQICTSQNQLAICKDTDNDGCLEQLFEQCTFGCSKGICNSQQTTTCSEAWLCTQFTNCQAGIQTRSCTDQNKCGTTLNKPPIEQTCSCTEKWECNPFTECSGGIQTRYCYDTAQCETQFTKPILQQSCASCTDNTQNQGEEGVDCGGPCTRICPGTEQPTPKTTTLLAIWWSIFALVLAIGLIAGAILISHHIRTTKSARGQSSNIPAEYMQKLVEYIQKDISLGYTRTAIEKVLLNEGWSKQSIDQGFLRAEQEHHLHAKELFYQQNMNRPRNPL